LVSAGTVAHSFAAGSVKLGIDSTLMVCQCECNRRKAIHRSRNPLCDLVTSTVQPQWLVLVLVLGRRRLRGGQIDAEVSRARSTTQR
jgi:hypothetical protein